MSGEGRQKSQEPKGRGPAELESPLEIWTRFKDPMLRWADVPGSGALLQMRMQNPDDRYLQELELLLGQDLQAQAIMSGDSFWGNPPPAGSLPRLGPGRVPIAALHTGDILSISVEDVMRNVLVVGPTGGGKSNWLRVLIAAVLECDNDETAIDRCI